MADPPRDDLDEALTLERIATARSEHVFHFGAVAVMASRNAPLISGLIAIGAVESLSAPNRSTAVDP